MATISENLQIIKDSTDAIKQAIADKGGDVSGDITTWASAINAIESGSGGGSSSNKIFSGTGEINMLYYDIFGSLDSPFDENGYVVAVGLYGNIVLADKSSLMIANIDVEIDLSLNVDEPFNIDIPFILFFTDEQFSKVVPITIQKTD